MRILFIVPYVPSLIRFRSYNLIRQLTAHGHQVTVLTLYTGAAELADVADLGPYCQRVVALPLPKLRSLWNCLIALPSGKPLQAMYCWQPALARKIKQLIQPANGTLAFDVVHIEHLRGSEYGLFLKKHLSSIDHGLPIVWDSVDCISHLFRQAVNFRASRLGMLATRLDLTRTERYEGRVANQFEHVVISSDIDKLALLDLVPNHLTEPQVSVVPNGVDLAYFCPGPTSSRKPDTLIFSGKMSYHANISMALYLAEEIMPRIRQRRPSVRLNIVGKSPPRQITALSQHPNISVAGTVPDIRPYLREATAAVVPLLYGAGTQGKILEAMACATPVITTPLAVAPLSACPGRDLLVADRADDIAQAVLKLLADKKMQRDVAECGRSYVETNHNWTTITEELVDIYKSSLQLKGSCAGKPALQESVS